MDPQQYTAPAQAPQPPPIARKEVLPDGTTRVWMTDGTYRDQGSSQYSPVAQAASPPTQPAQTASYTAPASSPFQEGQSGIPFGGGQFQWTGTGWHDPATGRRWDPIGNPVQAQQAPSPAVQYQQGYANPLVDWFKSHSGINVNAYNFGKLKGSTQELVLGAAEAAGHDKQDVLQDIQRTLPRATGPRTGYVAPLGR